ncbi:MAG TPA: hypothetical protein VKX25_05650 [Bryobacteraceae bacterium]|nr:hypothetical protein [Bryobacteraceae bacterium]
MRIFPALVSIVLTPLVTLTPVLAQTPETAPSLELRVLESNAPDRLAVAVTDAAGQHIPDATVVLRLPQGAFFSNASETATVQTDANGIAQFQGIQWGPGGTVRLTASKGSAHAGLLVEKPPVATPPASQPIPASQQPVTAEAAPAAPAPPVAEKRPPQPGVVVENDDSPYANVPIRPAVAEAEGGFAPKMSIVSSGKSSSDHHMRNRILIGVAVAAGAGAAFFLTRNMHSGSSSSSGTSIGSPTVSVGHP